MIHDWQTLTAPALATLAERDPVAVLVLGAIEQHGTHLPLGTDLIIGEGLMRALREKLDPALEVVCLPTIAVGASDEHASFGGTLSLPAPLAIATLEAYGESVARAGIKRLVLINSHGGNKAIMDLAALTLRKRFNMRVVKATYTRLPPLEGAIDADELRYGLHGGLLETAMMHYLAPASVNLEGYQAAPLGRLPDNPLVGPEGAAAFAWLAEDLSQHGVAGDAQQADAALGERLVNHYAAKLADVIAETARLPAFTSG
ncbi:creatinine amidohydrolase [Vreelandella songnenensis]|uniref:Creatinine amidohydrolase n=1 Tax=Vreelandella songnenensis TaxID=1176243 RepID=A0A2T0V008_9GAMM|nr:creatininase family protein [Halomonas songnenensis]PRY63428.1 creatinine amidohydrolase [Halomonas songnenensis]